MGSAVAHDRIAVFVKPSRPIRLGLWLLNGAAALALALILLPLVLVTWLAFFRQEIPSFPPEGYSLQWFAAVPANKAFVNGFILSFEVGVTATIIGLVLAVPAREFFGLKDIIMIEKREPLAFSNIEAFV